MDLENVEMIIIEVSLWTVIYYDIHVFHSSFVAFWIATYGNAFEAEDGLKHQLSLEVAIAPENGNKYLLIFS